MISIGTPTLSIAYSAYMRSVRPAPDGPTDDRGLPHGDVLLRHVVTLEVIRRHRVDAEGMLASGQYEAAA
jgi:hypothetical protein